MHTYEICPRKDKRGFDLISDALPFFFPELRSAAFRRTSWNGSTSLLPNKRERFYTTMRRIKKRWIKPMLKSVPIFFECTCYAGAVW
jgi:hypothetical protein